jgi:acetylornithine deacetylase/succinyl-diaminopimelate desuccinylase-like protein
MEAIDGYISANQERFLDELRELLRFPSISAQPKHHGDTQACAQWLYQHLADLGCHVQLVDKGGRPVIVAEAGPSDGRSVVIYGHYDVQPEDPLDQWLSPPFEPTLRDGFIYARGATDDKGQLFAHIKALETLLKTQNTLPCRITLIIEGEEESGGHSLARFVREEGASLRPEAVIVSDGTMYDLDTPCLNYGLRGIVTFEFTVRGPDRDVHSGTYGGAIANPALVLAQMLAACVDVRGRILIPGFYDGVDPIENWEKENIDSLGFRPETVLADTGAVAVHGEPNHGLLERLWARPTFEVNGIYGGYQGDHSKTIIPAQATAKVSMRMVPRQDPEAVVARTIAHLRQVCPDTVRLDISEAAAAPPVVFDVKHPILQSARAALRTGFGREPVFTRCGGSIPVVSTFADQWQCPVVLMGLGQDNDGPHSPNERFRIDSFIKGIRASTHLLMDLK